MEMMSKGSSVKGIFSQHDYGRGNQNSIFEDEGLSGTPLLVGDKPLDFVLCVIGTYSVRPKMIHKMLDG